MVDRNLGAQRAVIDLNCDHHEPGTIAVRATDGSSFESRVSQMCATLQRQLPGAEFLVLGSVSVHGVCAVDLPRESARHRRLPAFARPASLSSGHSGYGLAQHPGRCQRKPRLADLCRFRRSPDRGSAPALSPRGFGIGLGEHGLCLGLHRYRSVHDVVPLGSLQVDPARPEAAYAARSARFYPHIYSRHCGPRCTT